MLSLLEYPSLLNTRNVDDDGPNNMYMGRQGQCHAGYHLLRYTREALRQSLAVLILSMLFETGGKNPSGY